MLQRTWTLGGTEERMLWDFGNEFWEFNNDILHHYRLISRTPAEKSVIEIVEFLPECPIPLEAIPQKITNWNIEQIWIADSIPAQTSQASQTLEAAQAAQTHPEKSLEQATQPKGPRRSGKGRENHDAPKVSEHHHHDVKVVNCQKVNKKLLKAGEEVLLLQKVLPTKSKKKNKNISDEESLTSDSSQNSCILHNQGLWSSLSQWIPPSALYQPSLHHQAVLELSDIPVQILISHSPKQKRTGQYQSSQVKRHPSRMSQGFPLPSHTGPLFL